MTLILLSDLLLLKLLTLSIIFLIMIMMMMIVVTEIVLLLWELYKQVQQKVFSAMPSRCSVNII